MTSDAGALLLGCLRDARDPAFVEHEVAPRSDSGSSASRSHVARAIRVGLYDRTHKT
jgi:hypothetical protein